MRKIVTLFFLLFVTVLVTHSQTNQDSIFVNRKLVIREFHVEFGAGLGGSSREGYSGMVGGGFFLEPQYKIKRHIVLGLELGLKGFGSIQGSISDPSTEYQLFSILPSIQVKMDQTPHLYFGVRTGLGHVYGNKHKIEESSLKLINSFNIGFYIWRFNIGLERSFYTSFSGSGVLFLKFKLK